MKKNIILLASATLVMMFTSVFAVAEDNVNQNAKCDVIKQEQPKKYMHRHQHISKEEMEKKKIEFENRLGLTEEQKKQIELQKQKDREAIKPILDEMHQKRLELRKLKETQKLSNEEFANKAAGLKSQIKELKIQADDLRKANMKNFENILTDEQKTEFEKIKKEQKKEMEKRRKNFKGKKGAMHPPIKKPVGPKPIALKK